MADEIIERRIDQIGNDQLPVPEIRLIQDKSTGRAKELKVPAGSFFNMVTEEVYPDIEFVIVDIRQPRARWPGSQITDSPPVCSSDDVRNVQSSSGEDCTHCEYRLDAPWAVKPDERREKCIPHYMIQGLLIPHLEPFILRVTGTSSQEVGRLIQRTRSPKLNVRNEVDPSRVDYHKFKVAVSVREQQTPYGPTYGLKFGEITPFGDPEIERTVFEETKIAIGRQVTLLPEISQDTQQLEAAENTGPAPKINTIPATPAPEAQVINKQDVGRVPEDLLKAASGTPAANTPAAKTTTAAPKRKLPAI